MKYLKVTLGFFLSTLIFASIGVNAEAGNYGTAINDLTIPINSGIATSGQLTKMQGSGTYQMLSKTGCTDNLTGDERAISGRIQRLTDASYASGWSSLPRGKYVIFDGFTKSDGIFKSQYKSDSKFLTTASYYGVWFVDWYG